MKLPARPTRRLLEWTRSLRFPQLLALSLVLLAVDLAVPDPVPFLDEILLAVVSILVGRLRRRDRNGDPLEDSGGVVQ